MMQSSNFLINYLPIVIFFAIATLVASVVMVIPRLLAVNKPNVNKSKSYECGFDALGDAREKFDVRFYLVAILFIIFDLEVAFLVPWAIGLRDIGDIGFWSMMFFLMVLTIGFIYEWKKGALDWQ